MALKKSSRGPYDSLLLGPGHTFRASAVPLVLTVPDFCENQRVSIPQDQVNFTETRVVVTHHGFESTLPQKVFGNLLPMAASLARGGQSPPSGTGRPRLNSAQAGLRCRVSWLADR